MSVEAVDIVLTYVNNKDKFWQAKYNHYNTNKEGGVSQDKKRFNYCGEILFNLRLLQRHMPWVRKVFVVHDNQKFDLSFLTPWFRNRVTFVDHHDIIPKQYLPTFNSQVIECFLWRIPGLARKFIYLNDDVFVGRPLAYEFFFDKQGKVKQFAKLRTNEYSNRHNKFVKIIKNTHDLYQRKTGRSVFLISDNFSWNLDKLLCRDTFSIFWEDIKKMLNHKVRKCNKHTIDFLTLVQMHAYAKGVAVNQSQRNNSIYLSNGPIRRNDYVRIMLKRPPFFVLDSINMSDNFDYMSWNKIRKHYLKRCEGFNMEPYTGNSVAITKRNMALMLMVSAVIYLIYQTHQPTTVQLRI